MSNYCSSTNVQNRLTANGIVWIANRDGDGSVSASETAAYITTGIEYADAMIDAAIQHRWTVSAAKASGNVFLREIAVDLAAARAVEVGGRQLPERLAIAFDRAMQLLEEIRTAGRLIPGLAATTPQTRTGSRSFAAPRAVNPR